MISKLHRIFSCNQQMHNKHSCGLLDYRPQYLQCFANIKAFVFVLSVLVILQQALSSGYINSVITTIERRYEIQSSTTGIIASFYEIGNLVTVLFVSYFGTHKHTPVWIARGAYVMALGSFLFSLPHFITPVYIHNIDFTTSNSSSVCKNIQLQFNVSKFIHPSTSDSSLIFDHMNNSISSNNISSNCDVNLDKDKNFLELTGRSGAYVVIFVIAQLLLGSGGSPLFPLGITYIDDHVQKESSSFYIGCMYSMVAFGPVFGFLLGAYMLSFQVDALQYSHFDNFPDNYDESHPQWIGLWWAGFIICGVGMSLLASLLFFFPKSLENEKKKVRARDIARQLDRLRCQSLTISSGSHTTQRYTRVPPPPLSSRGHRRTRSTQVENYSIHPSTGSRRGHRRTSSSPIYQEYMEKLSSSTLPLNYNGQIRLRLVANNSLSVSNSHKNVFKNGSCDIDQFHGNNRASIIRRSHNRTLSNISGLSKTSKVSAVSSYGRNIKDLPLCMWKLFSNPIYIVTCLGACTELMIVSGFILFLPKYLETQFGINQSQASVFAGGIAIPGAGIGVLIGGYLLKRFQLRPKQAVQMIIVLQFVSLAMYSILFVIGCDNMKMAGATTSYTRNKSTGEDDSYLLGLTSDCNRGCSCNSATPDYVCGSDGVTYFSACHAGCYSYNHDYNYTHCTCVANNSLLDISHTIATPGVCRFNCSNVVSFMVLLFFMSLVVAISQMPLLMIILRSVDERERSFALGMQFVIFRLLAYIPSPILFGSVIDSTCIIWKKPACSDVHSIGRCLHYNIEFLRFKYVGICTILKTISVLVFIFDWLLIRRRYLTEMQGTLTIGDIVNSIVSIDRGCRETGDFYNDVIFEEFSNDKDNANGPLFVENDEDCAHIDDGTDENFFGADRKNII